jgi:hypothetical protein
MTKYGLLFNTKTCRFHLLAFSRMRPTCIDGLYQYCSTFRSRVAFDSRERAARCARWMGVEFVDALWDWDGVREPPCIFAFFVQ